MTRFPKKIILFDDDKDIVSICTYILEEAGWEAYSYTDCDDIVARVKNIQPHLILMDNWIPGPGGVVATQMLKDDPELNTIPVIYFSANSEIQQLTETAGADGYLAKPFDLADLQELLSKFSDFENRN
jgi:two-component system cell cycle response regulator DivK